MLNRIGQPQIAKNVSLHSILSIRWNLKWKFNGFDRQNEDAFWIWRWNLKRRSMEPNDFNHANFRKATQITKMATNRKWNVNANTSRAQNDLLKKWSLTIPHKNRGLDLPSCQTVNLVLKISTTTRKSSRTSSKDCAGGSNLENRRH